MKAIALGVVSLALAPLTLANSLWKISQGDQHLYLAGTVHVMTPDAYPLSDDIQTAFEQSDVLVLEIANLNDPSIQQQMMAAIALPEGQTLQSLVKPTIYEQATKLSDQIGLPIVGFDGYKPWFFATSLTMMYMAKEGYLPQYGLDAHYQSQAEKRGMKVYGLETVEFQLQMFDNIDNENPNVLIEQTLKDVQSIAEMANDMRTSWETGDMKAMETLIVDSMAEFPKMKQAMLDERNQNWMKHLAEYLKTDEVEFVAVGAGHMPGDQGVLELAKKAGYQVEQIK